MAITNDDFDRLRHELDVKIATVTVEQVNAATAIAAYAERINGVELRVDSLANEMDRRFDSVHEEMNRRFESQSAEMNRRFISAVWDSNRRFDAQTAEMNRRFDAASARIDRLDRKLDTRFNWQTVTMVALGLIAIFNDVIQAGLGL